MPDVDEYGLEAAKAEQLRAATAEVEAWRTWFRYAGIKANTDVQWEALRKAREETDRTGLLRR